MLLNQTEPKREEQLRPKYAWLLSESQELPQLLSQTEGGRIQGEVVWRRMTGEAGDLLSLLSEAPVTLNWPSLRVLCLFLILKDWCWQPLQWTKVRGTRYVQPAVYDRWPFNRLGPLKLLLDPPVDLFLMRWDFFSRSPPKPPFLSPSCCVAEPPVKPQIPTPGLAGESSSIKSWLIRKQCLHVLWGLSQWNSARSFVINLNNEIFYVEHCYDLLKTIQSVKLSQKAFTSHFLKPSH